VFKDVAELSNLAAEKKQFGGVKQTPQAQER
jgi:hypothetical protein